MSENTTQVNMILSAEDRATATVNRVKRAIDSTKKELDNLGRYKNPLKTEFLFDPNIQKAVEKYSRGMGSATKEARTWANAQHRAGELGLKTWDNLQKEANNYLNVAGNVRKGVQDLTGDQIKGFQRVIARMSAVENVYSRLHNKQVQHQNTLLRLNEQLSDSHKKLGSIQATNASRALIGAENLADFQFKAFRQDFAHNVKLNSLKSRHLAATSAAEKAELQRQIDAQQELLAAEHAAQTKRIQFRTRGIRLAGAAEIASGKEAERSEGARQGRMHRLIYGNFLQREREKKAAEKAASDRAKAEEASAERLKDIFAAGDKIRSDNHKAWIGRMQSGWGRIMWGYAQEDKAAKAKDKAERKAARDKEKDERKAEKARDKAAKAHEKEQEGHRAAAWKHARQMASTPFSMMNRADGNGYFSSPVFYALGAGAAATGIARSTISAATDVDRSETQSRIHMDLSAGEAKELRSNATRQGLRLGVNPDDMIDAITESAKAGVPKGMAPAMAELTANLSKIFGMNMKETTQDIGYAVGQELGAGRMKAGPEGIDAISKIGNIAGALAGAMQSNPGQMMSFVRTGMGTGAMYGLSKESTLAFGAAATSVGAQGQQASRMLGHMFDQIYSLPMELKKMRAPGHKLSVEEKFLKNDVPRALQYTSLNEMLAKFKESPDEMFEVVRRLGEIEEPMKRAQVATALFGADFGRFISGMAMQYGTVEKARRVAEEESKKPFGKRFSDEGREIVKDSWEHILGVMGASWKSLKAEFGEGFKPFAHQFEQFFSKFAIELNESGLNAHLTFALQGAIEGLGFNNLTELLEKTFGIESPTMADLVKTGDFFKGFTGGLKNAWNIVKAIFVGIGDALTALGFDTSTPEAIGKLVGSLLGLSLAVHFLRPAFSVIGFIKDTLLGLGAGLLLFGKVLRLTGLSSLIGGVAGRLGAMALGGIAATPLAGLAANAAVSLSTIIAGFAAAILAIPALPIILTGLAAGLAVGVTVMNWDGIKKYLFEGKGFFPKWFREQTGTQTPREKEMERIKLERKLNKQADGEQPLTDALRQWLPSWLGGTTTPDATVRPQSYSGSGAIFSPASYQGNRFARNSIDTSPGGAYTNPYGNGIIRLASFETEDDDRRRRQRRRGRAAYDGERNFNGLIHNASFSPMDEANRNTARLARQFEAMGARVQLAALSSGVLPGSGSGAHSAGGGGGHSAGGGSSDPARAFGSNHNTSGIAVPNWLPGRGGAGGSASSNPANSAASARMLDAIAGTESGRAGYDAVLGNGRYGTPNKPISQMTVDEAYAFGRTVRARHGSSSALGRYQIVGQTMRAAQQALGIDGNAKFDPAMQDRMARWIARKQGLGAWEGLKHNPRAMAAARQAMQEGGAQDAPNPGVGAMPRPGTGGTAGTAAAGAGEAGTVAGGVHPLGGAGRRTSGYGMRNHPVLGGRRMHHGVDLAAPAGTAVSAMRGGVVSISRQGDVTVKHDDGSSNTYRHVDAGVQAGQRVAAGQRIAGLRANDPRSTGPHLHLEGKDATGKEINPETLLAPRQAQPQSPAAAAVTPSPAAQAAAGAAAAPPPSANAAAAPSPTARNATRINAVNPAAAVDAASAFIGFNENNPDQHKKLSEFTGQSNLKGDFNAWCTSFLNASLKASGVKPSDSPVANSYLKWGAKVDNDKAQAGDVMVIHRNKGPNAMGGHTALSTGKTKMEDGKLMMEAISANSADEVKQKWYDASEIETRRSAEAMRQQQTPAALARTVPTPPPRPPAPAGRAGGTGNQASLGGGMGGGGGVGPGFNITINGANRPGAELAGDIQRHVAEAWSYRSHDMEPELT